MKVLIFGAAGMLGRALVKILSDQNDIILYASQHLTKNLITRPRVNYLVCNVLDTLIVDDLFNKIKPDVVVNCIAPSRSTIRSNNVLDIVPLCTLFPHRLQACCLKYNSRLVHISTDAVFSGNRGLYCETDIPDPIDVYGRAKLLGEVSSKTSISIRTSMIGHENNNGEGLLDWFLSQKNACKCYRNVIFSGFPVCVLAGIIAEYIIRDTNLYGTYNLAAQPISKYDLLSIVANVYQLPVEIIPDDTLKMDRSLSPVKFNNATGFIASSWVDMIRTMHADYLDNYQ